MKALVLTVTDAVLTVALTERMSHLAKPNYLALSVLLP
jgi:uncharacterized membrane protein